MVEVTKPCLCVLKVSFAVTVFLTFSNKWLTNEITCMSVYEPYSFYDTVAPVHGHFIMVGGLPGGHQPPVIPLITRQHSVIITVQMPRVGPGTPLPLVHLLPHLSPFLLFPFFHWLYRFSSFVHPFPFYQNSPTPFPGRRS